MIGATISHYKILEKLGGGGMGVVYKAEDTKLKRLVALKFLPPDLTSDIKARERFAHEAQAAYSLEHPHICTVHDIGETEEGQTFIVMSFYEGETLRRKLTRGRLKVEQALEMTAQIADGLACAHEHGIVHRDIKPANIMVLNDGTVKVLDFGLAKLAGETRLTKSGATVGTLMYMAPEQVQAQETDSRADIWALGAMLQEMITGAPPFRAEHEAALLYEIVSAEPAAITDTLPDAEPELLQLVTKCLEKLPEERYQSAKDVSVDCRRLKRDIKTMRQMSASHTGFGVSQPPARAYAFSRPSKSRSTWIWMALSTILLCITVLFALRDFFRPGLQERVVSRSEIAPPENGRFYLTGEQAGPVALSPDGRRMVFLASGVGTGGNKTLWLRHTGELTARFLKGTEDAAYPFWSPDNRSVGYFAGGSLWRVDVEGGEPQKICNAKFGGGGSWNKEGIIIFSPSTSDPILRVPASGGNPVPVTRVDSAKHELYHQYPLFLPDGKHFLFLARTIYTNNKIDADSVYVASLGGLERRALFCGTTNVCYSDGYLVYYDRVSSDRLVAAPFDLQNQVFLGDPKSLVDRVQINSNDGGAVFSVSRGDLLVYQVRPAGPRLKLLLYDRNGIQAAPTGPLGVSNQYWDVRLSPDASRIAYTLADTTTNNRDIWIFDQVKGTTRLTHNPAPDRFPVWSPDGKEIVFCSNRREADISDLYRLPVRAGADAKLIFSSNETKQPFDWSKDGEYIAFIKTVQTGEMRSDIWILPVKAGKEPFPFLQTKANEWDPHFSPDGKWIVYCSDETGPNEVYVAPFPGPGEKIHITSSGRTAPTGGSRPRWAREGKEIFYLGPDNMLWVAEVKITRGDVEISDTRKAFQTGAASYAASYDVSRDGTKIIVNTDWLNLHAPPLILVANWTEMLPKK